MAFLSGLAACASSPGQTGVQDSGRSTAPLTDAGCMSGDPNVTHVLIDDMETTTHGPIELDTGIASPLSAGYWYNSGASYFSDAGADTSNPPQLSFVFSALPTPRQCDIKQFELFARIFDRRIRGPAPRLGTRLCAR